MRICFVLLLDVTALTAVVSGSSVNLRTSGDVVQDKTSGRELRGDLNIDEAAEERASFDFLTKLASRWKGDQLKSFAKKQAGYIYSPRIFDDLLQKFPNPDALHKALKLDISKNRPNIKGQLTWRSKLYQNFLNSYLDKFPTWRSKLT